MKNPLDILADIADEALALVFGREERLQTIRCSGLDIPSDFVGSITDYMAMKKGLVQQRVVNSIESTNKPSNGPAKSILLRYNPNGEPFQMTGYHWE